MTASGLKSLNQLRDTLGETVLATSTPFSEAASVASQLVDQPRRIHTDSRAPIPPQLQGAPATLADVLCNNLIFSEAATALQQCPMWVKTSRHVQLHLEVSSRTVIDSILIWASDIAQDLIIRFPELDESLQLRHGFGPQKGTVKIGDQVHDIHSWVALHQGITIPPQIVSPGVSLHGKLNYVAGILDASMVDEDLNDGKRLRNLNVSTGLQRANFVNITEANSLNIMAQHYDQALGEGAAICAYADRNSTVDVLTNGFLWSFIQVQKSSTVKTQQLNSAEAKPFKYALTRQLDIERDLTMILKLLVLAILGDADDFHLLSECC
ncbi:hypothetical protein MSAN_01061100 [Mycena sanguinolenta]|uniref:Uncharacterized protein n=1 Tax=Mycena sanguinolenta TaxID=230812 RepID=A0A8H6YSY0_9AGAR|nr:hypothetical protein MSAN_01061100 [Mycena sanguinolenta]